QLRHPPGRRVAHRARLRRAGHERTRVARARRTAAVCIASARVQSARPERARAASARSQRSRWRGRKLGGRLGCGDTARCQRHQERASPGRMSRKPKDYTQADRFTRAAKAAGYPARSVFKLEEIQRRYRLFRSGQRVLDLGAAPGSWSLYASREVGPAGRVLAVDLSEIGETMPGNVT